MKKLGTERMNVRRKQSMVWVVALIVLVVTGVIALVIGLRLNSANHVNNFQECKTAGGAVAESYPEQCFINGKSFTNDSQSVLPGREEYVGLSEESALEKATKAGKASRVVERDGKSLPVTMDYAPGRLNLFVKDDRVYRVEVEGGQESAN